MATTLTGANQTTEWWDLRAVASDVCFTLDGDFTTAVTVQYSNNETYTKPANDSHDDPVTYSAKEGPREIPFGTTRFVRFKSSGSWTASTTCTPRWARAKNDNGKLHDVTVQDPNE